LNCWHANVDDSMAMWSIYGRFAIAVAITTTVAHLRDTIEELHLPYHVSIARVKYVKHWRDPKLRINPYSNVFAYKVKAYDFERRSESSSPVFMMNSMPPFPNGECLSRCLSASFYEASSLRPRHRPGSLSWSGEFRRNTESRLPFGDPSSPRHRYERANLPNPCSRPSERASLARAGWRLRRPARAPNRTTPRAHLGRSGNVLIATHR
jgi:hypothetical protein